jgi:type IV secretory pathway TrbL component
MLRFAAAAAGGTLADLVTNVVGQLETIGKLLLVLLIGYLMLRFLFEHRLGACVAVFVVSILPALFILDPTGATTLLTNTVNSIL